MISRFFCTVFLGFAVIFGSGCGEQTAVDPASAMARVDRHITDGDPNAAIIELKNLLMADPNNLQGRWKLAELYLKTGQWAAAEAQLRRAQELGVVSDSVIPDLARSLLQQGKRDEVLAIDAGILTDSGAKAALFAMKSLASLEKDELPAARSAADTAIALDAEAPEARFSDAAVTAKEGAVGEAEKKALSLTQSRPEFSAGWSLLGDLARMRKDLEAAEHAYSKAIDTNIFHPGELYNRALIRIELQRLDEAQEDIERLNGFGINPTATNYALGILHVARGATEKALASFEAALKRTDNHPESLLYAGSIKLEMGETEVARDYLERAVSANPEAYLPRKLLATIRLREDDHRNALQLLRPMIESGRLDEDGTMLAVQALIVSGQTNRAMEITKRYAETASESPKAQYMLGFGQLLQGAESDALKSFDAALSLDQDLAIVDETLIRYYLERKQFDKALARALGLKDRSSGSVESLNLLGLVYLMSGDAAQAEAQFLEVDAADPGNVAANAGLARVALRSGDTERGDGRYRRILEFHDNNLAALNGLARLAARRGDADATREHLMRAVESHPNDLSARVALARIDLLSGESNRALTLLEDVYSLHRDDPAYLRNYVLSLVGARKIEKARVEAERLVKLEPDSAEARHLLARVFLALDEPGKAKEELASVVLRDPANVTAHEDYIRLLLLDGDLVAAESQIEELAHAAPRGDVSKSLRAILALARNEPDRAKYALERTMDEGNTNINARELVLLAFAKDQLGETEQALQALEQVVVAAPENIKARLYLANLMARAGRDSDTVAQLEEILKLDEENVVALNDLAWQLRYSDPARALSLAEEAFELEPDSAEVADTLIAAQLAVSQVRSAERTAERALEQHPGNPLLLYRQATVFAEKGMKHQARRQLEEVLTKYADFPERGAAEALLNKLKQQ